MKKTSNRRGRPTLPSVVRRSRMITVRVTDEAAAKFERAAAAQGKSLSSWLRSLMFAAVGQ